VFRHDLASPTLHAVRDWAESFADPFESKPEIRNLKRALAQKGVTWHTHTMLQSYTEVLQIPNGWQIGHVLRPLPKGVVNR